MRLIEGVLLTISPAENNLLVNPYFKKELRIYYTISMKWDQRRAMVTSELGSDLVYVEKTPVSSFSSKGDMLSRRAVSQAGFLPFSKEERRHTRRKNTFPNTLISNFK